MTSIAHIVNPVHVGPESDLFVAQPVTFETMRRAREFARPSATVDLLTSQYHEDREPAPSGFAATPDLERSALDIGSFRLPRKLPFLKDILDRLCSCSSAELLVYTNVDIAVQPYFYLTVAAIAAQGYDAFVINRRTISSRFENLYDIPLMYSQIGERHQGWDCFVFRREIYPGFALGEGLVGSGWIGRIMLANMACHGSRFKVFTDEHLTFHLGNRKSWKSEAMDDYLSHNREECRRLLLSLEKRFGPLDRREIPGRFLSLLERQDGGTP